MAGRNWRKIMGNVLDAWCEASLALDPAAFAVLRGEHPDVLEDEAITVHRRATATTRAATWAGTAALRRDALAG
jgi:hypothetical protein